MNDIKMVFLLEHFPQWDKAFSTARIANSSDLEHGFFSVQNYSELHS